MARYSPSCEKLIALMLFLWERQKGNRAWERRTHSQTVMVRTQIHSARSNMFTIESFPPDARYLGRVRWTTTQREHEGLPSAGVERDSDTSAYMGRGALAQDEARVVDNAQRMLRVVSEHDAVADVVEHRCGSDDRAFFRVIPRVFGVIGLFSESEEEQLVTDGGIQQRATVGGVVCLHRGDFSSTLLRVPAF